MSESLILGLASFVTSATLGGLALYFGYRARSQPFREHLYETQLAFVLDLAVTADALHSACSRISTPGADDKERLKRRVRAGQLARGFFATIARAHAILPIQVGYALGAFMEAVTGVTRTNGPHDALLPALDDAFAKLVVAIRAFTGVDPMSDENLRMFRSLSDPNE